MLKYILIIAVALGASGFNSWGYVVSDSYVIPLDKVIEAKVYISSCKEKLAATAEDPLDTIAGVCADEAAILYGRHVYRVMSDNLLGEKEILHTSTSIESINNFLNI